MNSVIGYLGLGNMGQPMASRLMDAGNNISVFDIDETAMKPLAERQALQASSPRDLADKSEIVICSLPSNSVIREAVLGNGGLIEGEVVQIRVVVRLRARWYG